MASSLLRPLARLYEALARQASSFGALPFHTKARALLLPCLATGSLAIVISLCQGYRAWLRAGQGGVPANPLGYITHLLIRVATSAQPPLTSVRPYADPKIRRIYGRAGQRRYLETPLPQRPGGRAKTLPWTVPHRQAERNSASIRARQSETFEQIVQGYQPRVVVRTSVLEKHGRAAFLADDALRAPWQDGRVGGEICHWHLPADADGSGHVTLSLEDAREVIEKGWGERHALSGVAIPWGYVLLAAPLDEEELRELNGVMKAGVEFALAASTEERVRRDESASSKQ